MERFFWLTKNRVSINQKLGYTTIFTTKHPLFRPLGFAFLLSLLFFASSDSFLQYRQQYEICSKELIMKTMLVIIKKELNPENIIAAISCLILSITIFVIMHVMIR